MLSFLSIVRSFTGSAGSWAIGVVLSLGASGGGRRTSCCAASCGGGPLLPTAVVTGLGVWLYTLAAIVWMPTNVANNFVQFGAFGIALSFVTWFTGMAFIIVAAAVVAPSMAEGDDLLGRWVRGGWDVLTPGAASPLPAPLRPVRISDAFGCGARGSGVDPQPGPSDQP